MIMNDVKSNSISYLVKFICIYFFTIVDYRVCFGNVTGDRSVL